MGTRKNLWFFLFVLRVYFSLNICVSNGVSTISAGQSLTGTQTIISTGGNFELGFFSPSNTSQNYYIGIWYKKVSVRTIVWVANRAKPLSDPSSSELKISEDGNLVLLNQYKIQIWSTNSASVTSNSTEAVLLDDGNLVLRDGSELSTVFWQSFDHPTDTWLPGAKLGLNKLTNKTQFFTSWKNRENPAPGIFSLELDPVGTSEFIIRWNGSQKYWSSGVWDGKTLSSIPELRLNHILNFSYVTNENQSYFIYSVYNTSIIFRFVMYLSGHIKQFTWSEDTQQWDLIWAQPIHQCQVYHLCGPFGRCSESGLPFCECLQGFQLRSPKDMNLYDGSGGCVRSTPLKCGGAGATSHLNEDRFLQMSYVKLPENPHTLVIGSSGSAQECKLACLNNCSCTAYAYESKGCSIWLGNLLNLQQLSDGDTNGRYLYLRLAASEFSDSEGKKKVMIIIRAVAVMAALLGFALVLIWRWRKRKLVWKVKMIEGSLVPFGYKNLQSATNNFAEKLGEGGFGSVFKGTLPDSTVIAVKKLGGLRQGEKQFRTEVSTIGTIQHVNLIRLRGFCSEDTKRLLVYDYMPNGSLDSHLFHQKDSEILDWKTRYQIALGTARGLAYLHENCRDCIIHCDIKPENILLDAEFCPKVSDFGLAKLLGKEFSRVLTTMRGTRGYLAPEWISGAAITAKADVYSYGMMLFEVISGRRNLEQSEDGKVGYFPIWASRKITQGEEILHLLDYRLEGKANLDELSRACIVACWCIQDNEAHRPSMGQIVHLLEGVLEVNLPPIPMSLQVLVENETNKDFFSGSWNKSLQPQSITWSTSSQARSTTSSSATSLNS